MTANTPNPSKAISIVAELIIDFYRDKANDACHEYRIADNADNVTKRVGQGTTSGICGANNGR